MNVLHVVHNAWPDVTGGAIRTRYLAEAQARMGVRAAVLAAPFQPPLDPGCASGIEYCNGIPYYRCYSGSDPARFMAPDKSLWERVAKLRAFAPFVRRIRQVALAERAHVIHAHSLFFCGLAAVAAGRSLGVPVVYEVRSLFGESGTGRGGVLNRPQQTLPPRRVVPRLLRSSEEAGALLRLAYRLLDGLACRLASHVVVLCEGLRGELIRRGIKPGKITVSGNGADLGTHIPEPAAARGNSEPFVIGYIGTLLPYEGLDVLLDAAALLAPQHPELRLLIAGDGSARTGLENQARRLGLESVRFAGRVAHEEVASYYRQIDLFVLPRRPGGLSDLVTPLKPLEIMAHGKPVLASDCGGHRELIAEGVNGALFGPYSPQALAQRIKLMMADREGLARLAERAREWVSRNRSWESQQRPVVELYQKLVAGRPLAPGEPGERRARRHGVLLVAPGPGAVPTGGVETGVGMILQSSLATRHEIRLWDRAAIGRARARWPLRMMRRLFDFLYFAAHVAIERPRAVHVKSSSGVNFVESALYTLIARALGGRVLLQLHSGELGNWYGSAGVIGRWAIRLALRWPSGILALSEYWRDLLQSIATGRPIHIVPNGVIPRAPAPARQRQSCIRVLTIAMLGGRKGHFDILDAASRLRGQPIHFVLAGPDETNKRREGLELRRWAMVMGLEKSVEFLGPVGLNEKWDLLSGADIFLLPSRAEGMPNAVLEAMAVGLPVVATPVGAVPEMLSGGRGGVLVPIGDVEALARALLDLASDPARREAMGRWNRAQVQAHYSFDQVERLLDELYAERYAGPAPEKEINLAEENPAGAAKAGAG